MIVGSGSIANMISDREGFIFFAAGASKSNAHPDFQREHDLMLSFAGDDRCFVYFSTISQYFRLTEYTKHKRKMEEFVKSWFPNYCIIRLGNIWECTNPNTFINYIKAKQAKDEHVNIKTEEVKYMISQEQLLFITDNIPATSKHEISIFGEMLKVSECLNRIK